MIASTDLTAAMVAHTTTSDVKTVIVNGEIVKRDGVLQRVNWDELKEEFVRNRIELEEMYKHINWDKNTKDICEMWYLMSKAE